MNRLALAAILVLVFAAAIAANYAWVSFVDRTNDPEPQYCHSLTEDGPIVDCDYQGDTNTWEPR